MMAGTSWIDAVAYYEDLLADGDRGVSTLQRLVERAAAKDLAALAEVVAWTDCLAATPAGRPYAEGEPFVLVSSADDWPYYGVDLYSGGDDSRLASWFGEGEAAAIEVIRDLIAWLQNPSTSRPAVPEPQAGIGE
ncbi:MAG TPA: hypothetical protein VH682_02850 [Gemmataceae bacterium]